MIIVSQDKNIIVNFDNTMVINTYKLNCSEIDYRYSIFAYDNIKNVFNMGTYKTEERAKEVLKEIIKTYRATRMTETSINRVSDEVGVIAIQNSFVYKMPLE